MKLKLITIGTPKARHFAAAAEEYRTRLGHYTPFEIIAVKDDAQALKKIAASDYLVLCDKDGTQHASEELATHLERHHMRGTKQLVFFIGGPDGAGTAIRARANETLSFSKMTFAHELALVMLLEQLYRAHTIIKKERYHK